MADWSPMTWQTKNGSNPTYGVSSENIKFVQVAWVGTTGAPPWSQAWGSGLQVLSAGRGSVLAPQERGISVPFGQPKGGNTIYHVPPWCLVEGALQVWGPHCQNVSSLKRKIILKQFYNVIIYTFIKLIILVQENLCC